MMIPPLPDVFRSLKLAYLSLLSTICLSHLDSFHRVFTFAKILYIKRSRKKQKKLCFL